MPHTHPMQGKGTLQSMKELYGTQLGTTDGPIGRVSDFYFDSLNWAIRYVVVDTGPWPPGRQTLLSPHVFGCLHQIEKLLPSALTRKQIEGSPVIESNHPLSRGDEDAYHHYYGWLRYWQNSAREIQSNPDRLDAHLCSTKAVDGYLLQARDGKIGQVCDFMMDTPNWVIRQLVVETDPWLSGRDHQVHIPMGKIDRISCEKKTVSITLPWKALDQSHAPHTISSVAMA